MADLKTTKEERAWLRDYATNDPCKILELSKAQTEDLLDDLDTLEAENAALRAALEAVEDNACDTKPYAGCCDRKCVDIARKALEKDQ